MYKYKCNICGYVYDPHNGDPDHGIEAGTPFEDLDATWKCPNCNAKVQQFHRDEPSCIT